MKDISHILEDLSRSVSGIYERNTKVMNDISFAKVPRAQWSDSDNEQYANKPKPENNKIARQINRILGQYQKLDINAKIVAASNEANEDNAMLLENRWRNDFNMSRGVEALQNAADEAFHGGFGAFKIRTAYEDEENPDPDCQNLEIVPIYSAASSVFFSAGAIEKDKSDSDQGWHLVRVNNEHMTEKYGRNMTSVGEQIDFFDWDWDINKDVYIAHYYEITRSKEITYDFGFMTIKKVKKTYFDNAGKMEPETAKKIIADNTHEETVRVIKIVQYALIDGQGFLDKPRDTAFKRVPLFPQYGYHSIINGIEYFVGEVARQRDNQRFLNMGFSAMMQILAENQVGKNEYTPEQVEKHKEQFARANVDDYPYLVTDPILADDGSIAHLGAIGRHEPPQIGTGLQASLEFLNSNIDEQGSTGQTSLPANVSQQAMEQVNQRADDSYQMLYQNAIQTIQCACYAWIEAAQVIYFSNQRNLRVQNQDDSFSQVKTLQYDVDENDDISPCVNDGKGKYDVVIKTNESFLSMKEAERQESLETLQYVDTSTEVGQMALLNVIVNSTNANSKNIKKLAKLKQFKILLENGLQPDIEDQSDSEILATVMKQMQQPQQPDANMVLAQAEQQKAQADQQKAQVAGQDSQIKAFDAETKRLKVGLEANKQHFDIQKIQAETKATELEPIIRQFDIAATHHVNIEKMKHEKQKRSNEKS